MSVLIFQADHQTIELVHQEGSSFLVQSKLVLRAEQGSISYTTVDVPAYTKKYGAEKFDPNSYLDHPDKAILLACLDEEFAGQIRLEKYWNGYAYIEDIAVEEKYRRQGIGRRLLESAIGWAKARDLPGMMLETQDNNVPACRLYEKCGFVLGGFDLYAYRNFPEVRDEIALYWYLFF